jgi:ferredoxin-type protein NapG
MERRNFFKLGFKGAAKAALKVADTKAENRASHWIRPPFAVRELDFLLLCTRCDKCIDVCEPKVLFHLAPRLGAQVVNTPVMDLLNKGCLMCEGWPCVTVCEPKALVLPEDIDTENKEKTPPLPKFAKIIINKTTCLPFSGPECGACKSVCPVPGALTMDGPRPQIDPNLCTGCALCRVACIVEPKAVLVSSLPEAAPNK